MPEEFYVSRNIPCVLFHFNLDGQEYPDDFGKSVPFAEFYEKMKNGASTATSQVNAEEYTAFFEPFLKEGKDIIHITLSSGISGAFNSANIAAEELMEKYGERKIYIVDSLCASGGYGMLMQKAADMRDSGMDIEELKTWVEENRHCVHHWFFTNDLTYFCRGGRVSKTAYVFGSILNINPLLYVDPNGKLAPYSKCRGEKKVIAETVRKMMEYAGGKKDETENAPTSATSENDEADEKQQDGGILSAASEKASAIVGSVSDKIRGIIAHDEKEETYAKDYSDTCIISEAANMGCALELKRRVEEAFPLLKDKILINSIGTTIGAHSGPGTIALFFWGDARKEL